MSRGQPRQWGRTPAAHAECPWVARRPSLALARPRVALPRLRPAWRPLLAGLVVGAALLALAYLGARETSVFAVRSIDVRGATAPTAAAVRAQLADVLGESLVGLDAGDALARVRSLPAVSGASLDRSFPGTLRVQVRPERPVAVLRRGAASWLVSARGRVLAALEPGAEPGLPRIWIAAGPALVPGHIVEAGGAAAAVRALARVPDDFPLRVRAARSDEDGVTLVLAGELELRLGEPGSVPLKLAVAAAVLRSLSEAERAELAYLDVATPGRVVGGLKSQLSDSA
jgi:cell division protein FtsQ